MKPTSNEIDAAQIEADICVVGGGPVGLTVALAAAKNLGLRVVVLETGVPSNFEISATSPMDSRVYALSPASRSLLESLGVWQAMDAARLQAVYGMRIWGNGKAIADVATDPDLEFAAPNQSASIATIVEHNNLLQSLRRAVCAHADIRIIYSVRPCTINVLKNAVFIGFTDNDSIPKTVKAKLLIGADGVNSWVRASAGFAPSGCVFSYPR